MAKTKTLIKQKESSKNIRRVKLKPQAGLTPYSPTQEILKGDVIGRAILECLRNNDPEGVIEVISIYLNALNRVQISKKAKLSRSTLYYSFKHKNPTIKTLARIMSVESPVDIKKQN
jgi:DNA-binding phage protein